MTDAAFQAEFERGLKELAGAANCDEITVESFPCNEIAVGDTLVLTIQDDKLDTLVATFEEVDRPIFVEEFESNPIRNVPVPYAASLLLCLFVARDKQLDTLGDFEEKLNKVWIPTCGPRMGLVVCICHAIKSIASIIRIGVTAAIVDRIIRAFGW